MSESNEEAKPQPDEISSKKRMAIALRYDTEKDAAPMVLASGRGVVASEIVRIAEDNNIPLYENSKLAELLTKVEIDAEIPAELYVLVAEVLFFVYQLDRMAEKRTKLVKKMKEEIPRKP